MDLHDRPYYGKQTQEEGLWVRGRAKDGTTRFYRIATAYLRVQNLRFTLGICFVLPDMDTVAVLQRRRQRIQALNLPLRGCCWIAVSPASACRRIWINSRSRP